jgi:hypothetical protein
VTSSVTVPSGLVTFYDGSNTLGVQQIYSNPLLLLDTNLLTAGTHQLTAVYSGYQDPFDQQATYQPSTSAPVTVTVSATATSTTLSPSTTMATAGTVVTFIANVDSSSGGPFGGVTFYDGSVPLETCSLVDGTCSYSTASLSIGTHGIAAVYNANATFASSTSPASTITINAAGSALTPTAVALEVVGSGELAVLTANVVAGNGIPIGTIRFLDNGSILGSSASDISGTATLTIPRLAAGLHSLYATFAGTPQFAPSVSPLLTEALPAAGEAFSLTESAHVIDLTSATEQGIVLAIVPTAGFEGTERLSCSVGVPAGYSCSFSPESLASGNSSLRLLPQTKSMARRETNAFYAVGFGIFCFVLITGLRRTGAAHSAKISLILICLLFSDCGNPSISTKPAQMTVLSIQATSGSVAPRIVKSVQIVVTF